MNPYKSKRTWVHAKTGSAAGDSPLPYMTRGGNLAFSSTTKLGGAGGDINAVSKKDLMEAVQALARAVQGGEYQEVQSNKDLEMRKNELVTAAIQDKDGSAWKALGEVIGDEVFETMGRQNFAAKTLIHKPLAKGEIGRIRIRKKDVLAYFATRNPEVIASQVRQYYVYPPEYYLVGRVLIEDAEIRAAA